MSVSKFRERYPALLDRLPAEGLVITRGGKPIARITPIRQDHADLIGKLAGVRNPGRHFLHGRRVGAESWLP